jgi:hypothetical protein
MFILKERGYNIELTPDAINVMSEHLARLLVKISKNYEQKVVDSGNEEIVYEIYTKVINAFIRQRVVEIRHN